MPVPTSLSDLDIVAANNSPPGTESAKGNIDNYLRAAFAFIKQNSNSLQLARGNYSNYSQVTTNKTVVAADLGGALFLNAPGVVITMPTPTSIGAPIGAVIVVFTTIYSGSIAPDIGAVINYDTGVSSVVIKAGQSATLIAVTATTWQVINATAELKRNADFSSSLAANGWAKHPSGLLMQGGSVATTAYPYALSYVTFPVAPIALVVTGWGGVLGHSGRGASGASIAVPTGATTPNGFDWIAFGY